MQIPETSTTLLRQLAADSQHARWTEFVGRYQPMMMEYLRLHFPKLEAEDIVSETFIALVDILRNYRYDPDETGRFHNYLTGVLRYKALHRLRLDDRSAKSVEGYADCRAVFAESDTEATIREWKESVFAIAIDQLMSDESIQERTRQVFLRVVVNHELPDVVARSFGIERNAVDQIKSRMMAKSRACVESLKSIV